MTFGKRPPPPSEEEKAKALECPHCHGVGAIRGRGQRKVCVPCKGTGKRLDAPEPSDSQPQAAEPCNP
jgi:hypothetical protein